MADLSTRVSSLKERAQETAQEAKGVAKEAATAAGQRAQEIASGMASAAAQKTEGALSSVGQSMSSLGGTIREKAPQEGVVGSTATAMAERLESGGRYLQEHHLGEMRDDFASLIRNHPMSSLCVAFGLGCLIGMMASRR